MKVLSKFVLFVAFITAGQTRAGGMGSNQQGGPEISGKLYTLGAAVLKTPDSSGHEVIKLQLKPRRKNTPKKFSKIRVQYYKSTQVSDKLVFVMTGLGGDGKGNIGNFLAQHLSRKGFHAFVIPSLFFKRFAYAISSSGHPGNIPEDVKDYYFGMQNLIKYSEKRSGIKFSEFNLLGYSLGGITALHLANEDSNQKIINFKSILALNPPVDLIHGINVLDSYYERTRLINPIKKTKILLDVGLKILKNVTYQPTEETVQPLFEKLKYKNERDFELLISESMRGSLADIIIASQNSKDINVLSSRCLKMINGSSRVKAKPRGVCRKESAEKFKFIDYISKILVPYYKEEYQNPNLTVADLSDASSIPAVADFISKSDNVFLIHNEDDILLRSSDSQYLKSIFGDRSKIYPNGGHLGNVWTKKFLKQVDEWIIRP